MAQKKRTEISELGEFGLIEKITSGFTQVNKTTHCGPGDDAAVLGPFGQRYLLLSTDLMLEGIDFDLTYFPLSHLGYKAVVVGISDILAMNGRPQTISLSLGISGKLGVEHVEELYEGVGAACESYGVDLAGGDTTASLTGLVIGITATGTVPPDKLVKRSGARENDLICVSGDLGAAYLGAHLLEREKRALEGHPDPKPDFEGYEYILRRQIKPEARLDIVRALDSAGLVPTAMIDLSDGLSSDLLQICKASHCGARIYLDSIAIAKESYKFAEQINADPVVAALNGGDDHELLFTVPLAMEQTVRTIPGVEIIGHITAPEKGAALVTPDGSDIPLTAQGIRL